MPIAISALEALIAGVPDPDAAVERHGSQARSEINGLLQDILSQRLLEAHFQPIVDLKTGEIDGYEGLIRGPADTPLRSPLELFRVATKYGQALRLERLCRQTVIEGFAARGLPKKLFMNVRPQCLALPGVGTAGTREILRRLDVAPERIVIELTENLPFFDFGSVRSALTTYRSLGFHVAIDDLGEGFSSFRLWSELRPEYVKADMHFVQGIDRDPLKLQFLKAIQQIADTCGSVIIAEGIETEAELSLVRDLGILYGQGYLIARPEADPVRVAPAPVLSLLRQKAISVYPEPLVLHTHTTTAEKLLVPVEPVAPDTLAAEVLERFERDPHLQSIPVVEAGIPVGLIDRYSFVERFLRPFHKELFGRKPVRAVMDTNPLVVPKDITVQELSSRLVDSERRHLAEGFVLTENGRYAGLGAGQDLVREITRLQITAARYANPLTLLPGNVPINEHIERLLDARVRFVACHCDLDHFKPYNDCYGYRRGDDMIQLLGHLLSAVCDGRRDFLGHVGGDDFILLMQSEDWVARCEAVVERFDRERMQLFAAADLQRGELLSEDRQGKPVNHPLTALSIGAVVVEPGWYLSHYEVSAASAEAKRQAKRLSGSSLFVERRRPEVQRGDVTGSVTLPPFAWR